ncbi:Beta-galactosidase-1-like protein [Dermatophagoides pteronyssinus]|uniref:Beta-galactosidase n=1 Tax=Dermatophagoides pteronyssinus TaxID=6956 RepID=A0ABQ8JKP4_DERPT|nr:Beta-galactosidase-1-like protein [Dermatophagoides pteronyssinus]
MPTGLANSSPNQRTFTIDENEGIFRKDGEPFRYVSGSMHYFRIPEQYWLDRLQKARQGGLNAIQTYIEWSSHQPEPEIFDFKGNLNFLKYFQLAQQTNLLVIIRLGPFIAAERDNSGLPYWLASKNSTMQYRTSDPLFLHYVHQWYSKMLPLLKPYLYQNGGPIIMAQIENEYGSFIIDDDQYKVWLRDIVRFYLGHDLLLFTVDGNNKSYLIHGTIDNVYPTIDFGPGANISKSFDAQNIYSDNGPLVNSEYYTVWFDCWGTKHQTASVEPITKTFDQMLALNASVNFYMYHGGTSFGFMNGYFGYWGEQSAPMTTSYDYVAPIGEYGQLRPLYFAIRKIIQKYFTHVPPLSKKSIDSNFYPSDPILLNITELHDRSLVFVNEYYRSTLTRMDMIHKTPLNSLKIGDRIGLLVENQGHACCTSKPELKGIVGNVTLGNRLLKKWKQYPLFYNWSTIIDTISIGYRKSMKQQKQRKQQQQNRFLNNRNEESNHDCMNDCPERTFNLHPAFYLGVFNMTDKDRQREWFLDVRSCSRKGQAFLNGHNLGRYWPVMGPQITLYIPNVWFNFNDDINTLLLFELESEQKSCFKVKLINQHILNGTVPDNYQ